ncbi:MAG: serine/threonine protein kinase [Alphaproteobacteria bacterium]|nr:serine/threonine protein kinase [Alphaproteobacteria bacterium]
MRRRQYRPPPATLAAGRYELLEAIGSGGMASVFRVRDHWEGCDRAAKILNEHGASRDKTRNRFLKEARTMSQLDHRNIVRIFDIGEEDGHYYFVMELAVNGSLAARMRQKGAVELQTSLRLAFEALLGLEHAHAAGVVHRDIKPHNILLSEDDEVKLSDFGIARLLSDAESLRITGTGDMLGTVAYMAPEQRLDPRKVGPEADIYSIGATLYMMITGRRPMDLALAKLDPNVLERLPIAVRPIVRRAIAHRPEDRYGSAHQMAEAIAEIRGKEDPATPAEVLMDEFEDDQTILRAGRPNFSSQD